MSDTHMARSGPYRQPHGRRRAHRPISVDGLPSPEELASMPHKGEAADRFSLYTPEQIAQLTRNAKIEMTFSEPIKIRDQAEMIKACMEVVIQLTRGHQIGTIRQRIETRREIGSLVERLTIFNGKTPYGYRKKKR